MSILNALKKRINILRGKPNKIENVYIDTMGNCINRCYMCPARAGKKKNIMMPDETFQKIIDDLTERSFDGTLSFYGQDEPFLDMKIFNRIRYAHNKLPKTKLDVISNFVALTDKKIDEILTLPLYRFTNSIYALKDDQYEKICGRPNFKTAITNQIKFSKKWAKTTPFPFQVYMIDTEHNKDDLEFIRYFLELLPCNRTVRTSLIHTRNILKRKKLASYFPAHCLYYSIKVTGDGEATICNFDHDSDLSVGNVKDMNVLDIAEGEKACKMRREFFFNRDELADQFCNVCDYSNEHKLWYFLIPNDRIRHFIDRKFNLYSDLPKRPPSVTIAKNSPEDIKKKLQRFNEIFEDSKEDRWLDAIDNLRKDFYKNAK